MNTQEAIEKIKNIGTLKINDTVSHQQIDMVVKNKVLDIISQIHEPQKVVVPQFVAEWIEYCKSNELTLFGAFDPLSEHGIGLANTIGFTGEVWKGIDWAKRNQDTFARAWLDGYTVEKEKLYTVEIPNPNYTIQGHFILCKNEAGKVCLDYHNYNWRYYIFAQLTESEIKENFEWAWQFAEEVEDDTKI